MFNVRGSMDQILDELVQACDELKAKVSKIDREKREIEGKSKNTWLKWGSEFRIGVFKGPSDTFIVMDDLAAVPNDLFIKDFYKAFSKRVPCSPLQTGIADQSFGDSKLDRREDLVMAGEGAPQHGGRHTR